MLVLAALLTALVVLVAPGSAAPVGNVESWGTYGLGQGQYANATIFGVDPSDGSVYIGDMTEKTAGGEGLRENFRIQKFSANGTFQASVLVPRFYDPPTNEELATLFGVAVDPTLHRFYLLEGAKDPTTKEPYGQRILVFSTTPEGNKLVAPTGGPSSIALPTAGAERILNPTSIVVDPSNHEVEVLGQAFETEVAPSERRSVIQRVTSSGATGPRFTDTAKKLTPALESAKMITVGPTGTTYAITGRATKGNKTKGWELPENLSEIKEIPGVSAAATAEEWTFGLEQKVSTFTGGPELAISPDGETLYWKERIEAWSPPTTAGNYLIHGYSLKEKATTVDFGGATSGSCKITSADAMFGVTGEGAGERVVVLDPGQPNEEEQQAPTFGGKVLTFGRGGTGCPVAEAKFKVNGVEENSEFAKGTAVTFDASGSVLTSGPTATKGFVKEVIWKFGDGTETIKTSSGTTEAALTTTHAYTNGGTYKPTLQIRFKKPSYGNPLIVQHTVVVTGGGGTEEFTLKTTKEGSGTVTSSPSGINCGATCEAKFAQGTLVKLTGAPETGFKAPTWTGCDTVASGVCEVTMGAAKNVKATFAPIPQFLLKVKKEGNGSGTITSSPSGINCGATCEASFAEATLVKLSATPDSGSKAATWTGCDTVTGGVCEVTMGAAKEVKATFALEEFALKVTKEGSGTVSSSPSGINCGPTCEAKFNAGTLVKLTGTPETGFKAPTWTGCDTVASGVCEVTMGAAKNVKATFAPIPQFLLKVKKEGNGSGTITSSPAGINCGPTCEASYLEGTLVKLTASPDAGSKAATWTGCDTVTGGVCEVTMGAAKEVKATFALEEFTLKVTKEGTGTVTSSPAGINCGATCEAKFTDGTLVKLTGTPGAGFKGVTWTGCDTVTGGVCEVTVAAAAEVKATFVPAGQFVLKVADEGNGSGTVTSSPSGINCGPTCEASYLEGTLVKLTAAPGPGSKAATFTGCDTVTAGVCEVTMNAAKEVKVTFELEVHTLKVTTEGSGNVTSSPAGINCGSGGECEATFTHNTVVKLTGAPGSGFKAPVWTGCDTVTGGVCEVTISAAKEVKATFVPVGQFLLKVKTAGGGSGSVTSAPSGINCGTECEASYAEGTLVKLTATPDSGSKAAVFAGCDTVSGGLCEVTMNAARNVTATFESESTSPVDCSGSDIGGAGSTLQGPAQGGIWIPGFKALCPDLTVNYEASSSGAGLTAWGFKGGSFDKSKEFIATDEAPDPTEIAQATAASGSKVLTIPVAQTAIGIVVNPPTGCTISGLTNKQLESIMRGNIKVWAKIQTASGAGCINAPITRVVRADASGTTYQMKNYLFRISEAALACTEAPGKNWKQLEDSGTTGRPNTSWPEGGQGGCSAGQLSPVVTGTGGAGVVKKVNVTEGSIGYAALPDIEANKNNAGENPNGDTNWVTLQDNGLSNKLSIAKFAGPASGSSANCSEAQYPVPTLAQVTSKEPANADWSQIFGGNTNAAAISPGSYSLCALTYDIALTSYSKAGFTTGQETTAHSYLAEYLTAEAGQTALEAAGKFYAPLPDGGNPLHNIVGAAQYAASKIGY
ncbi:MAG TPA: PKD domain-containing protein [Solirubrobacterales bacterium]|nr:PKD domain-containing protein [Solirubrobacterales bacterium]